MSWFQVDPAGARNASPAWIISVALVIAVAVSVALVIAAGRVPGLPFALEVVDEKIVDPVGLEVTAIRAGVDSEPFPLQALDVIEEPDIVSSWEALDAFYERQGVIWRHLQARSVDVEIAGTWQTVPIERRGPGDMPLAFYTLLATALVTWIVGFFTYAFSDRGVAARFYAASAIALSVTVWPAALYSTRPLALEPETFRWLSTIDHLGGLCFPAGVISILAVFPVRLIRSVSWLWITALAATALGHFQVGPMWLTGFYTFNALHFFLFLVFAYWQWRASRHQPLQRAALGWILLSIFVGVIVFITLITLPIVLGVDPAISQTTGFVSLTFVYAGVSLGVLRYRLFDLDRWWFRTWSWLLGGTFVVAVDLVLTRLFDVTEGAALVVALIVVGWIYFPIRQRLFERFTRIHPPVAFDVSRLISADTLPTLSARFREALEASFSPLEILTDPAPLAASRLSGDGAWLEVPSPLDDGTLRCRLRDQGQRLYSRDDVVRANELVAVGRAVRGAITAREEGQVAERRRIRRDLHDDLGASIIRIAHEATDEHTAQLAQAAMRDLRDVLTALHDRPASCQDVLDDLEAELRARAVANDRELVWTLDTAADRVLSARARANLARVLRESMTNALKHGSGPITYVFTTDTDALRATVANAVDGDAGPVEEGFGLGNIVSRMTELGGSATYARTDGTFTLSFRLPWSATS